MKKIASVTSPQAISILLREGLYGDINILKRGFETKFT
jgi:hypothetical protein